jgi:hypothetical protein
MSPEQKAGGSAGVDARADVYSLGALLQWVAGADAPPPLRSICRKATADSREDRYPDVPALAADVTRFADGEAVSAHAENPIQQVLRLAKRHRVAVGIVFAYLVGRALIHLWAGR